MKTTFDLIDHIYDAVAVASVTGIIDGSVWRRKKPQDSELQDVVIVSLPVQGESGVQSGTVIINCFCCNLVNGIPNESKLRAITSAVMSALETCASMTGYFDLEIVSENTMQDPDNERMSYTSIRVNCYIER